MALSVTGKSLRDQNLVFWRKRAKHLSKGGSILGYEKYVLTCLQESLDNLDHKAIECFKNIGLFPEDQRIPAAALVDIWAELHNEDDETAMEIIYELVNLNMVDIIVTRYVVWVFDNLMWCACVIIFNIGHSVPLITIQRKENCLCMATRDILSSCTDA